MTYNVFSKPYSINQPRNHVLDGADPPVGSGSFEAGRGGPLLSVVTTVHVLRRCGLFVKLL